ncbi:unnamed protein product [Auanema sp. JU1783]|nr:unnamed protein product [Auanema sp. JU1783]
MRVLLILILFTYSLVSANNCTQVSIKNGDTCYNLWTNNGMTKETFTSANPTLNCQNLQVGQTVCIIPDPLLPGQYRDDPSSSTCQKLYSIKSGDTCQALWLSNALNETAFMSSNPGISCRNLQVGEKVCLRGYLPDTTNHQYDPYQTSAPSGSMNPSTQPSYSSPTPYYDPYPARLPYSGGNVQSNTNSANYIPPAQYQQSQSSPHSSQLISAQPQPSHIQTVPYQQAQTQTSDQQTLYQQVQSSPQQIFYEPQQTLYQPQASQSSYQPQPSQSSYQTGVQQTQQSQYHPQTSQPYYQPPVQQTQYQPPAQQTQYQPSVQQTQYQPQGPSSQVQSQGQLRTQQLPNTAQQVQSPSQVQNQPSTQLQYQTFSQPQQTQYESQTQPSVHQQTQYQPRPMQNQYQSSTAQAQTPQSGSIFQYGAPVSQSQLSYQPSVGQNVQQIYRPLYDSSSDTKVNETCRIHTIKLGDTCFDIWSANGMTQLEFSRLNPNVNCQTLQLGQQVCTDPNTLRPGQYRDDASCQKLYSIKAGDTCANLWQTNGITEEHFMQRNSGINCNNLQIGQDVCLS